MLAGLAQASLKDRRGHHGLLIDQILTHVASTAGSPCWMLGRNSTEQRIRQLEGLGHTLPLEAAAADGSAGLVL